MLNELLPSTNAKMRILKAIYFGRDMNLRQVIKKARVSPNRAVDYVNKLSKNEIVKAKKIGNNKIISFNYFGALSSLFFNIIEKNKKVELIEKYPKLKPFFTQLENLKNDSIILLYGSYARFEADKESDIDIWVIWGRDKELKKDIEEILFTSPSDHSASIEDEEEFIKNRNDPLHQNILKDKVIIKGEERMIEIMRKIKGEIG
jgi:predicted nucleotidyltransferase